MTKLTILQVFFYVTLSPSLSEIIMEPSKLSVIMNGALELEFHMKDRSTSAIDINPSPTLPSNSSQVTQIITLQPSGTHKRYKTEKTQLTYLYYHDQNAVQVIRGILEDPGKMANVSSDHREAMERYVQEWDVLIHEPGPQDIEEELIPELEVPPFGFPKAIEKWYKLLRIVIRLGIQLPLILELNDDSFWEAMEKEELYEMHLTSMTRINIATAMQRLCTSYYTHPWEMYPENVIEKIPIMDLISIATSPNRYMAYSEPLKWISFAKELMEKRLASHKSDVYNQNSRLKFASNYVNILNNIYTIKHDVLVTKYGHFEETMDTFPELLIKANVVEQSKKYSLEKRLSESANESKELFTFQDKLCSGVDLRDPKEKAALKCRYDHLNAPWFYLMPAKVEMLHIDPQITLVHHVLTDNKIKLFKALAAPMVHDRVTFGNKWSYSGVQRVAHIAYLTQDLHQELYDTSRISQYISGMEAMKEKIDSMPFKVNIYLPGEYFGSHYDVTYSNSLLLKKNESERQAFLREQFPHGRRISTLLFYLTDALKGGNTAFENLGLSVAPEEGSVLFFSSLDNVGDLDMRLKHEGCPVAEGTKWLFAKCMNYNAQLFTRPCPLQKPISYDEIPE